MAALSLSTALALLGLATLLAAPLRRRLDELRRLQYRAAVRRGELQRLRELRAERLLQQIGYRECPGLQLLDRHPGLAVPHDRCRHDGHVDRHSLDRYRRRGHEIPTGEMDLGRRGPAPAGVESRADAGRRGRTRRRTRHRAAWGITRRALFRNRRQRSNESM